MDTYNRSRERLFGLLIECPFSDASPSCPLRNYRPKDIPDLAHVAFKGISESRVQEILERHEECSCLRAS